MKNISFIGVGVMGKGMVRNLMSNGFTVTIYARSKAKVEDILSEGAIWADTIGACVKSAQAVITIVGAPKDVREVYLGENGIIANAPNGCCLIDMTTTSPALSKEIDTAAKAQNLFALDAPVSGGDVGAKNGTLAIMVGGEKEVFEKCLPLFEAMGTNIRYMGLAGAGQHTKMANQLAIAGAVSGVCEALAYAHAQNLDEQAVLDAISTGAAGSWQMSNMAPRMVKGDFSAGFFVKHFIKDLTIANEEAKDVALELPVSKLVKSLYEELDKMGYGDLGTQSLYKYYNEH